MQNRDLAFDYIKRCKIRLKAVQTLFDEKSWADVVRESQEVVELALKALLRFSNVEFPRVHDVSNILEAEKHLLPSEVQAELGRYTRISRDLRRDRELAFYGSEDLTPSEFYKEEDAISAQEKATWVVKRLLEVIR